MKTRYQPFVRINGAVVDPCIVVSGVSRSAVSQYRIEVQLSASVVLHELQECGVQVSEQTLRDFLARDVHDERGRAAYLTIAQSGSLTTTPRWRWIESSDVQLHEGVVTFLGAAIEYEATVAEACPTANSAIAHQLQYTSQSAMKLAARFLILLGIASMLCGVGSCRHYYAVNPPPEASQPGWDADAHAEPYIAFERFFFLLSGGFFILCLGFYLRSKTLSRKTSSH